MQLNRDIKSKWLLHAKGFLFLCLGLMAAALLFADTPAVRTLILIVVTIWAFCRFYYYLFYVLENYIGRPAKYAGILDALKYLVRPAPPDKE